MNRNKLRMEKIPVSIPGISCWVANDVKLASCVHSKIVLHGCFGYIMERQRTLVTLPSEGIFKRLLKSGPLLSSLAHFYLRSKVLLVHPIRKYGKGSGRGTYQAPLENAKYAFSKAFLNLFLIIFLYVV